MRGPRVPATAPGDYRAGLARITVARRPRSPERTGNAVLKSRWDTPRAPPPPARSTPVTVLGLNTRGWRSFTTPGNRASASTTGPLPSAMHSRIARSRGRRASGSRRAANQHDVQRVEHGRGDPRDDAARLRNRRTVEKIPTADFLGTRFEVRPGWGLIAVAASGFVGAGSVGYYLIERAQHS